MTFRVRNSFEFVLFEKKSNSEAKRVLIIGSFDIQAEFNIQVNLVDYGEIVYICLKELNWLIKSGGYL